MNKDKSGTNFRVFWDSLLKEEFNKETDRGAVIFAASLFDINLENLLKTFLLAETSSKDELFENVTGPLGNFSSKILMSYRLGLISRKFARDLQLIRKIRNEFAHNIHGCSFEHSSVKSRILELVKSSNVISKFSELRQKFPEGTRGDFLLIASWMLWSLNSKIEKVVAISECKDELWYSNITQEDTKKLTVSPMQK